MSENLPARRDEEEVLEGELLFGIKHCVTCGLTFETTTSDEEAQEEWERAHPGQEFKKEELIVVCGRCIDRHGSTPPMHTMGTSPLGTILAFWEEDGLTNTGEPKGILGWDGP